MQKPGFDLEDTSFDPTPGASGVAELTTAVTMSSIISTNLLLVFTLLHRFFLLYIPVILGVFTVLGAVRNTKIVSIAGSSTNESGEV